MTIIPPSSSALGSGRDFWTTVDADELYELHYKGNVLEGLNDKILGPGRLREYMLVVNALYDVDDDVTTAYLRPATGKEVMDAKPFSGA